MGKKTKQGKGRIDKYYHLAKDQGYRARSAFKLVQLAKKTDFLSKAKVCIDLCAAPGGWAQVAQKNMPSNSIIIAVDLMPIKPIHGVVCIQSDITTDKCRSMLKKEMKGQLADVVLHDGAPNVGTAWAQDAYNQNELTLHAAKLACEHLRPGGTFVTKVFRSADYNSLLWVFHQLFNKVDATRPMASRNVSAEIFVICSGFKSARIDPRFFDIKWVFMESPQPVNADGSVGESRGQGALLKDFLKQAGQKQRQGYEEGDDFRVVPVQDFINTEEPAKMLIKSHKLNLDAPGGEIIAADPLTTQNIRDLCDDLKVLGRRDLTELLKWRMKLLRQREKQEREAQKAQMEALKQGVIVKRSGSAPAVAGSGDASAGMAAAGSAVGAPGSAAAGGSGDADLDNAISSFLASEAGQGGDAADEDGNAEEEAFTQLDEDLAKQIQERRRQEKVEKKKTMERQKKKEWRKKITLGVKYDNTEEPDLFSSKKKNIKALEDEDKYVDRAQLMLEEDKEDSDALPEGMPKVVVDETDSEDGLDRLARMEVDLAVDHELRKMRFEEKYRAKAQHQKRGKKETRRQRVQAMWAGELTEFGNELEQKAREEFALKNKADADDEGEGSEDDLEMLRDFQRHAELKAAEKVKNSTIDAEALAASAFGERGRAALDDGIAGEEDMDADDEEAGGTSGKPAAKAKASDSLAVVAAGDEDDDDDDEEAVRSKNRAMRWFSQDIFKSVGRGGSLASAKRKSMDDDEEVSDGEGGKIREMPDSKLPQMPLTDKERRKQERKKQMEKLEKSGKKTKTEDLTPMEVVPLEPPKPLVPTGPQKPTDPNELAETLALGSLLVESKKSRMDLIDAAYNRWAFDRDEMLPDWFQEEEDKFYTPELPISKELMAQYRAKLREINARPIRKVAEARARKKRRLAKRLDKLRETAMSLADTPEMSERAKAQQIRKMMRQAAKEDQRKVVTVAMKKGGGGHQMQKKAPKGAKTKVVDRRMKSDKRAERRKAKLDKGRRKAKARKTSRQAERKKGNTGPTGKVSGGRGGQGGRS
mmetsp:Transcript_27241/g.63488  ORF Transcript_27241/g.63488 Transcript_27241/m.63488 type:complete len:1043 (+) Transcript_27241:76-3204(+)